MTIQVLSGCNALLDSALCNCNLIPQCNRPISVCIDVNQKCLIIYERKRKKERILLTATEPSNKRDTLAL